MAARFVVAVALIALCSANPLLINGVVYRDGRAYATGQAISNGGSSIASANTRGDNAQAYGSANGNQLSRDGYGFPGQALAQAQTSDFGAAKAVAQAQNGGYYHVPAPAAVITYEQNFAAPAEVVYEVPAAQAHSTAFRDGLSDSSITSASSNGGVAQSSANTGAGSTSSNAKTYGHGLASSNAKNSYGGSRTTAEAQTQDNGSAQSSAQTNGAGAYPVVVPVQEYVPTVIAAKTPVFHTAYVPVAAPGSAYSNANVVGSGNAAATAKVNHGRTISWRFGTLYDSPAAAQAQASTYGQGIAKSHANTNNHGYGSANADADVNSGYGIAKSTANVRDGGSANANADVNGSGYGAAHSAAKTYNGAATSTANTNAFGHAKANADAHQGYYGGARTSAGAQSNGYGSALSSARATPVSTAYRVANTQASSYGPGSAQANAQAA